MAKTIDGKHTMVIAITEHGLGALTDDIFASFSTADMCPQCSSPLVLKAFRNDITETNIDFQCACKECGCKFTEHYKLTFTGQSIDNITIPAKKERNK